jgi:hypothetical protein
MEDPGMKEPIVNDPASMFYWWPKVKNLNILVPRTELFYTGPDFYWNALDEMVGNKDNIKDMCDKLFHAYREFVRDPISVKDRLPIFMRGDLTSGKHNWEKTCYVNTIDKQKFLTHVFNIVAEHGLIDEMLHGFAFRQFIQSKSSFVAFRGRLPIKKEYRAFYDGKSQSVSCIHQYWPEDAIERGTSSKELPPNWRQLLKDLYMEDDLPALYEHLIETSMFIGEAISTKECPDWSLDFMWGINGWYFIDCAPANRSWHPEDCENQRRSDG